MLLYQIFHDPACPVIVRDFSKSSKYLSSDYFFNYSSSVMSPKMMTGKQFLVMADIMSCKLLMSSCFEYLAVAGKGLSTRVVNVAPEAIGRNPSRIQSSRS